MGKIEIVLEGICGAGVLATPLWIADKHLAYAMS